MHFQPQKRVQDSPNDLKLIASAQPVACVQTRNDNDYTHSGTTVLSLRRFDIGLWNFATWTILRKTAHRGTHGHAIPFGDGIHVLFTCEATGLLCLGPEQPEGRTHLLIRRFVLVPPQELWGNGQTPLPSVYASARCSGHEGGARIAAAYGDRIVLFSIPEDMLRFSAAETEGTSLRNGKPIREMGNSSMLRVPAPPGADLGRSDTGSESGSRRLNMKWVHWLSTVKALPATEPSEIWQVQINGICVGKMPSPQALAVQADGEIFVWAFGAEGTVRLWRG